MWQSLAVGVIVVIAILVIILRIVKGWKNKKKNRQNCTESILCQDCPLKKACASKKDNRNKITLEVDD